MLLGSARLRERASQSYRVNGADGCRLYVEETGARNGPAILFIHGFSYCRSVWRKQTQSDLANEFRLVAFDLRGHGLSDKPRRGYREPEVWATDIASIIESLDLRQPVVVAWSYGGLVLCDFLRCRGESFISGINLVDAVTKIGTAESLAVAPSRAAGPRGFLVDVGHQLRAGRLPTAEFFLAIGSKVSVPSYVRDEMFARSVSNDSLLSELRKPVLITHGLRDRTVLPAAAEQHAARIRQATTSVYPNAGHLPFWQDWRRFNRELRTFVRAGVAS